MGLFDTLRDALGMRAEADSQRDADPEDLFGMSTAYMTMEVDLGFTNADEAALCFAGVDSTDFERTVEDVIAILDEGERETGTVARQYHDDHGYEWFVLHDDDPEDLVTSVHFAADTFIEQDYGNRLLAALFGFRKGDQPAYWIYSFRRGRYYPFAPEDVGNRERNSSVEFKLESVLDGELDVEPEKEYWYPLWPSRDGRHPWE